MAGMSIYEKRNIQKEYDTQLKELNQKNQNKIAQKQSELNSLQGKYDTQVKKISADGQERINKAQLEQQVKLQKELEIYKEELGKYDDQLRQQRMATDKELLNLKKFNTQRKTELTENSNQQMHDLMDNGRATFKKLELENSLKLKLQNQENESKIGKNQRQGLEKLQMVSSQSDARLDSALDKSKAQSQFQQNTFRMQERDQKLQNDTELEFLKMENARLKAGESVRHNTELKRMNDKFQYDYAQQKKIQDVKYKALRKDYDTLVDRLQKTTDKEIESIVSGHSSFKDHLTKKIADRFYQVNLIDPQIQDFQDHYVISVMIPEHEQENVIASVNDRQIRVTMARRFEGEVKEGENTRNIAKRSETLTKLFHTEDILNNKGITQTYQDGKLSFKILKA